MKKMFAIAATLAVSTTFATSPALAAKVTAWDGRDKITVGGKTYEVSGKRTKVTIKGGASSRDYIKVGMDCSVTGGKEAASITCK